MAITKATASAVAPAAKGDLVVGSATNDAAVLGVGTDGQYLTAASTTATGLQWSTLSAGGMTLIQSLTLSASTGTAFSSIPSTYKSLFLVWSGLGFSATSGSFSIRFNNDSGTNYMENFLSFNGSTGNVSSANRTSLADGLLLGYQANATNLWERVSGTLLIDNYASTTLTKTYQFTTGFRNPGSSENHRYTGSGFWNSTSAITSLDIVRISGTQTVSNATNTSIRLYGLQ